MAHLVTQSRIKAVYTMLLHLPPFVRWGLPHPDRIKFCILDKADHLDSYARYDKTGTGKHIIAVNPHLTLSLLLLIENVAHEMVHLKQDMKGRRPYKATNQHNKEFFRMVRLVCRDLGLDPQRF